MSEEQENMLMGFGHEDDGEEESTISPLSQDNLMGFDEISELKEKLRTLETSPGGKSTEIATLKKRIEELSSGEGSGYASEEKQHDAFESWATETHTRYTDPSEYDGDSIVEELPHEEKAKPEPIKVPEKAPEPKKDGLPENLDGVRKYIVSKVLVPSYDSITKKRKVLLQRALSELGSDNKTSQMQRFKYLLKSGITKAFEKSKLDKKTFMRILYYLIVELPNDFGDIEARDEGATRIVRNIIAIQFLPPVLQEKLKKRNAL